MPNHVLKKYCNFDDKKKQEYNGTGRKNELCFLARISSVQKNGKCSNWFIPSQKM